MSKDSCRLRGLRGSHLYPCKTECSCEVKADVWRKKEALPDPLFSISRAIFFE